MTNGRLFFAGSNAAEVQQRRAPRADGLLQFRIEFRGGRQLHRGLHQGYNTKECRRQGREAQTGRSDFTGINLLSITITNNIDTPLRVPNFHFAISMALV